MSIQSSLIDYTAHLDNTLAKQLNTHRNLKELSPAAIELLYTSLKSILPETADSLKSLLSSANVRKEECDRVTIRDVTLKIDVEGNSYLASPTCSLVDPRIPLEKQGILRGQKGIIEGVKINLTVVSALVEVQPDVFKEVKEFILNE